MALSIIKSKKFNLSILSGSEPVTDKKPSNKELEEAVHKIKFYQFKDVRKGPLRYWRYHKHIKQILKNNKYDVVVAADLYSLSGACSQKTNIVFDSREIYSELEAHINKPIHRCFWSYYESFYLKKVSSVITTAGSDQLYLQNKYSKYKHLQFYKIYNYPINPKKIVFSNKGSSRPNKKINVLYQGVLQKGRGINLLLNLVSKTNNVRATIIGDGPEKTRYLQKIIKNKIHKRVSMLGKIPYVDLFEHTLTADVGWLIIKDSSLSNRLALPNKLFEYSLMGIPIIASNLPNMEKIITKYNLGKIINPPFKVDKINKIIKEILKRHKQNKKTQQTIKKQFTWDVQHASFIKILNNE
ncbi:MAG: hypothetical protein CMG64_00825 [Candidatus Marinimicrobia bacterium]|nr:hypothetical protein [Candidatus Neomarinimicrobiota bacterium]